MSETEISRRCLACGASVRVRAAFCPQCGQKLREISSSPNSEHVDELRTKVNFGATTQAPNVDENLPVTKELSDEGRRTVPHIPKDEPPFSSALSPRTNFALESHVVPETNSDDYSPTAAPVNAFAPTDALPPVAPRESSLSDGNSITNRSANELNTTSRRITTSHSVAPVGQEAGLRRQRADKLRDRSEAFIEEASDDPGLRFVLIAIALFLLFLVFLFFSHIIG